MNSQIFLALTAIFLLTATSTLAATENASSTSEVKISQRSEKKLGAYLGVLGDPAPTAIGMNLAYNLTDFLRVSAGYGEVKSSGLAYDSSTGSLSMEETGKLQTFGVGARAMMPGWNLSPVVGVSVGYMSLSGAFTNVQGLTRSGINAYGTIGVDYQARSGFNLALGYNFPLGNSMESNPYVNLGWFFDLGV